MTEPQHYKWMLRRDGQLVSAVQKKPWPVPVGEWTPEESPVLCESGWHAMEEKDVLSHLPNALGAELWVVETNGATVRGDDKFAAAQMRLTHHVGTTDARNLRLFACDVAEDVLPLFEETYPDDDRPRRAVGVSRRYAGGDATDEELDAARAARDAARARYSNWLIYRLWGGEDE